MEWMYQKIGVYLYKISNWRLQEMAEFSIVMVKNRHFPRYFMGFLFCRNYSFVRCGPFRVLWGHFSRSCRKSDFNTCIAPPKPEILCLILPGHLDLDWPWPQIYSPKAYENITDHHFDFDLTWAVIGNPVANVSRFPEINFPCLSNADSVL